VLQRSVNAPPRAVHALAVILYVGIVMLPQQMRVNVFVLLGSMVLPVGATAFLMGAMVHPGMRAGLGLDHAAASSILDIDSDQAAWGLLFGLVHWAIVGMALGTLPLMHSRIRYGGPRLVAEAGGDGSSEELLDPPSFHQLGVSGDDGVGLPDASPRFQRYSRRFAWGLGGIASLRRIPN
jgi:hypothetical protein